MSSAGAIRALKTASAARRSAISARSTPSRAGCCRSASGRRRRSRATCCWKRRRTKAASGSAARPTPSTARVRRPARPRSPRSTPPRSSARAPRSWGHSARRRRCTRRSSATACRSTSSRVRAWRSSERRGTSRSTRSSSASSSRRRSTSPSGAARARTSAFAGDLGRALGTVAHLEPPPHGGRPFGSNRPGRPTRSRIAPGDWALIPIPGPRGPPARRLGGPGIAALRHGRQDGCASPPATTGRPRSCSTRRRGRGHRRWMTPPDGGALVRLIAGA